MDIASREVLVHIQGHNFWLHFLPPIVRARMCAENVRVTYAGKMPARGIELLMPDGRFWKLRSIEGPAPLQRHVLAGKFPRLFQWLGRVIDLAYAWHLELQRALGRGTFERWEPVPEKRGQLSGHSLPGL